MTPKPAGIFNRLANWYNKGMKAASVYAPMISQQLRSPIAKLLLGDRATAAADIIDKLSKQLPNIDRTIKGTASQFKRIKREFEN